MIRWLLNWWHARTRRLDLEILWPSCCAEAADLDQAKAAFAFHCFNDRGWQVLGEQAIIEIIDGLKPPA